jgi:outer membrane protein assembly factor BamB
VGSALIHNGLVFGTHRDLGRADCVKLDTGESLWDEKLPSTGANLKLWTSPMLSGDRLYLVNQSGDVFVYRASARYEILAVNSLGEPSNSSVVPSNGELFLRTHAALWCIGTK